VRSKAQLARISAPVPIQHIRAREPRLPCRALVVWRGSYRNIFDRNKYAEAYSMKDVEKNLGLSREKLVRMALLLGSDYTDGVKGVGIVNAIEISQVQLACSRSSDHSFGLSLWPFGSLTALRVLDRFVRASSLRCLAVGAVR
jgi:hypothetical protein